MLAVDVEHVVAHRRDRRLRRVGLVGDRVVQELLDQGVDRLVERGREEQALAALRGATEDPAYGGQEAEVGHVVGLVEDGDLDVVQGAVTLADQVLEPARAGDDDVDALAEGGDLRVLADAAEDGAGGEPGGLGERREGGLDLADQLAGRGQDQGAGRAAPGGAAVGQPGDEREQERVGLAGAGAATAEHVAAGERVGQGRGLDRGRGVDALAGEDGGQACGHAEGFERSQRRALSVRCLTDSRGPKVSGGYARSRPELRGAATTCGQLAARVRRADVTNLPEVCRRTRILAHPARRHLPGCEREQRRRIRHRDQGSARTDPRRSTRGSGQSTRSTPMRSPRPTPPTARPPRAAAGHRCTGGRC